MSGPENPRGIGPDPLLDADPDGETVKTVINSLWDRPEWCLQAAALAAFKAGKADRSLRDWFAGQALAGVIMACRDDTDARKYGHNVHFAMQAYRIADAMLAERVASGSTTQ